MKQRTFQKLENNRGVNRLVMILLLAVLAMAALAAAPAYRTYQEQADRLSCALALKKAQDALDSEYLLENWGEYDERAARAIVERSMVGRDALCPAGGDYYLVTDEEREQHVTVVCGLHASDGALRTRLNAGSALEQIRAALAEDALFQRGPRDSVTVTLNGKRLTAQRVREETGLTRGTLSTPGYEGVAVFYIPDGGDVVSFSYADPDHCANWTRGAGWSGDSYG